MEVGSSQVGATSQIPMMDEKGIKPQHKKTKVKKHEKAQRQAAAATAVVENDNEDTVNWAWTALTENSLSNRPPVFTKDFRYFFIIAGTSVKIYATATGQIVSTLSSSNSSYGSSSSQRRGEGHTSEITAALIHPRNPFRLITASLDGLIKVWDYLDASLLSTMNLGMPITHMCAHEVFPEHVFVSAISSKSKQKERSRVYRVSLRATATTVNCPIHETVDLQRIGKMYTTTAMAISPSGKWLVATGGFKAYVCTLSSADYNFTNFASNQSLTCLAFHPTEEYFATGDEKGQIRLWYCLDQHAVTGGDMGKRAQTSTLHWHAHAVSSIAFSSNGAYLLSGGEEAVLVIWQLFSGKKEFVPRVGAPISSIAVASHQDAEEEYLLALSDGTLAFVGSGTLRISRSFATIKHDASMWRDHLAPLAVHTKSSTVVLPAAHPSSLLIYAPITSTLTSELEVSPSNRVSRQDEKHIEPSRVKHAVVSPDGEWLATVDERDGGVDFQTEVYLKIWQWHAATTSWVLNSRIDRPHGAGKVTALVFAPMSAHPHPCLLSTGEDKNVKVWRVRSVKAKNGEEEVFWICRSTLTYRSRTPSNVVSSPDGSLFAVTYERHVVIYETSTNTIRATLLAPSDHNVCHTTFIGSSGRYFVVADLKEIALWDLVSISVRWQFWIPGTTVCHLVAHPKSDAFVAVCRGDNKSTAATTVHKFGIHTPANAVKRALPIKLRKIQWYPYIKTARDKFSLIGITQEWTSVIFGDTVNGVREEGAAGREIAPDAVPQRRNLFQDIFGVSALENVPSNPPTVVPTPAVTRDDPVLKSSHVLNTPAHLLPPLETLYKPLVETFLQERKDDLLQVVEKREEHDEEEEEDVVMGDVVSPAIPAIGGRIIQDEEMEDFIELFKSDIFSSNKTRPTNPHHNHINGNGVATKINGSGSHRKASASTTMMEKSIPTPSLTPKGTLVNGKGKNHSPSTVEGEESSPVVVGKKRKKSLG